MIGRGIEPLAKLKKSENYLIGYHGKLIQLTTYKETVVE
jgi:hypothetical protein